MMLGALALCGLLLVGEPEPTVAPNVEVSQVAVQYDEQTEYEIDLLARLIYAESGSTWCSNKMQYYVGSVVLNRVASPYFPNTLEEVIYSPGQYTCIKNGVLCSKYDDRTRHCAEYLITNGSMLPPNVVFQAQGKQGDGVYEKVQNMYFCIKEDKQ